MVISFTCHGPEAKSLPDALQTPPGEVRTVSLPTGKALIFFSVLEEEVAECCLLLEAGPNAVPKDAPYLGSGHPIQAYVNARPWTTHSGMTLALAAAFGGSTGTNAERELDLEVEISALHSDVPAARLEAWIKPLGYEWAVLRSGQGWMDAQVRGKQSLADWVLHLQLLLIAADIDHLHWVGRERTIAALQQAQPLLATHPEAAAFYSALASGPYIGNRPYLQNLVEWQDDFKPQTRPTMYLSSLESLEVAAAVLHQLESIGASAVMQWMPEGPDLAELVSQSSKVGKVLLVDHRREMLANLLAKLNQSPISIEAKQKFGLKQLSPLYANEQLMGFDAILVEAPGTKLPAHHHAALEENLFKHCKSHAVIVIQRMHREFKTWSESMAKAYDWKFQVTMPKLSEPPKAAPLALAVFTRNR